MIADTQKKAFIRDGALVLYFEAAENPVVSRFDLDTLAQANFEVNKREPNFALVLKDFAGSEQIVAQFSSKAEAHQALYSILQALLDHRGAPEGVCGEKSSGWCRFFKWFFGILAALVLVWVILIALSEPIEKTPTAPSPEATASAPSSALPEGEAVDLDEMFSGTGSSE